MKLSSVLHFGWDKASVFSKYLKFWLYLVGTNWSVAELLSFMEPSRTKQLIHLLILLLFEAFLVAFSFESNGVEEFNEELLLKPLPDRKVLAHFHFESRAQQPSSNSNGFHHHLFPKAISQLVKTLPHQLCWRWKSRKKVSFFYCFINWSNMFPVSSGYVLFLFLTLNSGTGSEVRGQRDGTIF